MKCPQGLWVQTLITAVFQPTYMLTSTNMNASIFWKEIVQFSQRMILISWLFLHNIFTTYLYFSCVFGVPSDGTPMIPPWKKNDVS